MPSNIKSPKMKEEQPTKFSSLRIVDIKEMRRKSDTNSPLAFNASLEKRNSLPLCLQAPESKNTDKHFITVYKCEDNLQTLTHHWTLVVDKNSTVKSVFNMLLHRLDFESMSLFASVDDGLKRLEESELMVDYISFKHENNFVVKKNEEKVRFYLSAEDKNTFWTYIINENTLAKEIADKISNKLKIKFSIHLESNGRKVAPDERILFLYYANGGRESFLLKEEQLPSSVQKDSDNISSLLQQLGIDVQTVGDYPQIAIDKKWRINPNELIIDEEWIGEGSFSVVWGGTYKGNPVAIKQIQIEEKLVKYIQREVDSLQLLSGCPNIVQLVGVCQQKDKIFIVTEKLTKGDLWDLIRDSSLNLSWPLRTRLAMDIANAIKHYTSKNLIHRDLKSDNLLVQHDMTLKLCDFGLSKPLSDWKGTICGTQKYIAPEIIKGEEYDWKADIFSFGVILIELIIRKDVPKRTPKTDYFFTENSFQDLIPKDCPSSLYELAMLCLDNNPRQRPDPDFILQILQTIQSG